MFLATNRWNKQGNPFPDNYQVPNVYPGGITQTQDNAITVSTSSEHSENNRHVDEQRLTTDEGRLRERCSDVMDIGSGGVISAETWKEGWNSHGKI